jgi:hypothetical protein
LEKAVKRETHPAEAAVRALEAMGFRKGAARLFAEMPRQQA